MKLPASWNNNQSKNPSRWAGIVKAVVNWGGNSTVHTDTSPAQWTNAGVKASDSWSSGEYVYDSFISYDSNIAYDGIPGPFNTKTAIKWSAS